MLLQEKQLSLVEELGDLLEQQRAYATLGRTYATWAEIEGADTDNPLLIDGKDLTTTSASHYMRALKLVEQLRTKKLSTEKDCFEVGTAGVYWIVNNMFPFFKYFTLLVFLFRLTSCDLVYCR